MQNIAPEEKEFLLEIENEWTEMGKAEGLLKGRVEGRLEGRVEGRVEGRMEGRVAIVIRQLQRRFGVLPAELAHAIGHLPVERLEEFAEALLDFNTISDAQAWVSSARQTRD